jgi:transcriptional regulator
MYLPRHFAETDLSRLDALVDRDAFATLVSVRDGVPYASHLPVLYERDGERVRFRGHWARANPQWQGLDGQSVLLIVHGPHAYVSPNWYPDPALSVPTWNYAVAHCHGRIAIHDGEPAVEPIVTALAERFEGGGPGAWRFANVEPSVRHELRGIVGFELAVDRLELKFKLNQHHPAAKREGAICGLRTTGTSGGAEIANLMASPATMR